VSRRISPFIKRNRADIDAYAISDADIPIHRRGCSMNPKLLRRLDGPPDFVAVMFAYDLAFSLKIRVNWQKISPINLLGSEDISFST
jgi:hypothetical protein